MCGHYNGLRPSVPLAYPIEYHVRHLERENKISLDSVHRMLVGEVMTETHAVLENVRAGFVAAMVESTGESVDRIYELLKRVGWYDTGPPPLDYRLRDGIGYELTPFAGRRWGDAAREAESLFKLVREASANRVEVLTGVRAEQVMRTVALFWSDD